MNTKSETSTERSSAQLAEEIGWIQGIANGDRQSFRNLHNRFHAIVFSTIYKVLGNREDSEDVAQEVFAKIWKKAPMFDTKRGKPITWVSTMARNRAIDLYRSKVRRTKTRTRYTEHVEVQSPLSRIDTEQEIDKNEMSQMLQSAVMELTDEQQEAIQLAYFSGLTQSEVAERTGEALGTIKGRIRRGIQRLEKKVRARI